MKKIAFAFVIVSAAASLPASAQYGGGYASPSDHYTPQSQYTPHSDYAAPGQYSPPDYSAPMLRLPSYGKEAAPAGASGSRYGNDAPASGSTRSGSARSGSIRSGSAHSGSQNDPDSGSTP
jgi:hypothetical protein